MGTHAELAIEAGVDLLSIGSELNTTEGQVSRWLALVDRIRSRYEGSLSYTANWDRFDKVGFWTLVDVIGVSAYFELERDRPDAPVSDLVRAWAGPREQLAAFAPFINEHATDADYLILGLEE